MSDDSVSPDYLWDSVELRTARCLLCGEKVAPGPNQAHVVFTHSMQHVMAEEATYAPGPFVSPTRAFVIRAEYREFLTRTK